MSEPWTIVCNSCRGKHARRELALLACIYTTKFRQQIPDEERSKVAQSKSEYKALPEYGALLYETPRLNDKDNLY